jgi:TRAP-type mannitol/chloroaromatic compound transport system permease small subunit
MKPKEIAYVRGMDGVSRFIAKYVKYLGYVIMALLIFEVISRRIFNRPTDWGFFVTKWVFGVYFLLLASYGMLRQTNIRIDIFYANWSQRTKDIIDLIGLVLVWVPVDILVLYYGSVYAWRSFMQLELTPSAGFNIPIYPLKILMIFAYVLLLFQAISEIIKLWQRLNTKGEKV